MSHELNESQKRASEALIGPIMVLAGAGAGKTKTIVSRILNLIKNGVAPENILAITFTNKAAKEMRDRVSRSIKESKELNRPVGPETSPFVSTFHSLGVHILRENASEVGLNRHFQIYDRTDSKQAIKQAVLDEGMDPKIADPGKILGAISRHKGNMLTPDELSETKKSWQEKIIARVWRKYEEILRSDKALDFDDLLSKTAFILNKNQQVREKYRAIWKHIHVDEYQDTNRIQYEIVRLLSSDNKDVFVVGDIDQTIYTWRGAHIENLLHFEKDFPGAQIIILDKNYRSTKNILEAANSVIVKNEIRYEKNLYTDNPEGEKLGLFSAYDENDEALFVAKKAKSLIQNNIPASEIAVLYRANFQSRVLENAFLIEDVPYQVLGTKFFERKEIKDCLAYIKFAMDQENFASLKRAINEPKRGLGKLAVLKILAGKHNELPPAQKRKADEFFKIIHSISEKSKVLTPSELVKFTIKASGLADHLGKSEEDKERLLNLMELASVASKYDKLKEEGLEKFITESSLLSDQDELDEKKEAVRLMTVHASKGLEFDYCFIVGMETDLFPQSKAGDSGITKEEAEEERRLFYVALTRARKKVLLSFAAQRTIFGSRKMNLPSEFLGDIDNSLYNEERPSDTSVKTIYWD
jgi:DNA helicase-2/ATP-dependent DNA helicase PcrA